MDKSSECKISKFYLLEKIFSVKAKVKELKILNEFMQENTKKYLNKLNIT